LKKETTVILVYYCTLLQILHIHDAHESIDSNLCYEAASVSRKEL